MQLVSGDPFDCPVVGRQTRAVTLNLFGQVILVCQRSELCGVTTPERKSVNPTVMAKIGCPLSDVFAAERAQAEALRGSRVSDED